jgi:Type VI secretion system, TssO
MTPLNQPERKKAFINFLIFFAITVGLVVAAVLFSVEVPFSQNKKLMAESELTNYEKNFANDFKKIMDTTIIGLDAMLLPENKNTVDLINGRVGDNIDLLRKMAENDKVITNRGFYSIIVTTLSNYRTSKQELLKMNNMQNAIQQMQNQQGAIGVYPPQQQPAY